MREFFLKLLQNIDKMAGLKQFEKMCAHPDYKTEINNLLDILCRVADQFPFIPDTDKQKIINDAVITDQEFIGLNARIVYKWLNTRKELYFTEMAHKETEEGAEPLTGEAREARLREWLEAVNKMEAQVTYRSDIYAKVREQWKPIDGQVYKPTQTAEDLQAHALHLEYIKQNYDAYTKLKLENWMPEEEWLRSLEE